MKTIKMKKVLIAIDYNPTAQKVVEIGYSIAKEMEAEVTLLHIISNPVIILQQNILLLWDLQELMKLFHFKYN
ncbi:MAG: universal stress protein [Bacteroidales bacterium]